MRKTVESVMAGHADKMCDQIADAIVDECLRRDPLAQADLDVLGSHGMLMIGGELKSEADFDVAALARSVYAGIGYTDDIEVFVNLEHPSEELAAVRGPVDTVVVNGYATRETRERLPRPLVYAHAIARRLDDLRRGDPAFAWLRPDGKVQVSMEKDVVKAVTILASHAPEVHPHDVRTALLERVVSPTVGEEGVQIYINPAGAFTVAGFQADSGVNGRRLAIDTYGGLIPFGDNALSGKDPHKAERAGAYMARVAARYLVDQGLVSSAVVTVAYTFGKEEPISVTAIGAGEKARGSTMDLGEIVRREFDFRPTAIVERLGLARPLYLATATYGHFGRLGFPWEEQWTTKP